VTNLTAIGFSISDGATRALVEAQDVPEDVWEIVRAYAFDCTLMTFVPAPLIARTGQRSWRPAAPRVSRFADGHGIADSDEQLPANVSVQCSCVALDA
jgi:hypothetical protein